MYLARIPFRQSVDVRPWVVIGDPVPDPSSPERVLVTLAPVSSQCDLQPLEHFPIDASSPDFGATGLRRSSYVVPYPVRVSAERLERKIGELTGAMLAEFRDWCGD